MTESSSSRDETRARRYCLITPCRDEASYARRTIESVARQTLTPALWVIVDDGSTDETPAIIEEYAARLPYVRLVRRGDRVHPRTGALEPELYGDEMSVGMTKLYRRSCFTEIGGFVQQVMWDGIDCHRARMLGWMAETLNEESLRFVHLRPQGASHHGLWNGRTRAGFGQYFMGSAPLYHFASVAFRVFEHPMVVGSVAMLWGYWSSAWRRLPRYDDPPFRQFLRRYQYACLLRGKAAATAQLNAQQAPIWNAAHPSNAVTSGAAHGI